MTEAWIRNYTLLQGGSGVSVYLHCQRGKILQESDGDRQPTQGFSPVPPFLSPVLFLHSLLGTL